MQKNDKLILTGILSFIVLFLFVDMVADWFDSAPFYHFFVQVIVILNTLVGLYWIWKNHIFLQNTIITKRNKLGELNKKNKELAYGLSLAIDNQFEQWKLSVIEKEIGYLLLKGFSLKEISEYRKTAEITVRQQSARIYEKASLSGRTELSAYFMEDFLILPERKILKKYSNFSSSNDEVLN
jgi:DNA-binding CsgD family transcriptional regulator